MEKTIKIEWDMESRRWVADFPEGKSYSFTLPFATELVMKYCMKHPEYKMEIIELDVLS